ncbi:hypothetical protein PF008_g29383 [Phytophthora fragariae]|uniref:Uncharacterized protein n=1 Tax=Phytophthora fragariae TaxID=53985 RepID=A0A6G0Q999_9STRA|nr:hypothetical protein PF008_g29383 [Phytophthora fragariae]
MRARSALVSFAPVVSVGPVVLSACATWSTSSSPAWGPSRTGRRRPSPPDCLVPCACWSASSSPPTTSLAQVTRFRRTACSRAARPPTASPSSPRRACRPSPPASSPLLSAVSVFNSSVASAVPLVASAVPLAASAVPSVASAALAAGVRVACRFLARRRLPIAANTEAVVGALERASATTLVAPGLYCTSKSSSCRVRAQRCSFPVKFGLVINHLSAEWSVIMVKRRP